MSILSVASNCESQILFVYCRFACVNVNLAAYGRNGSPLYLILCGWVGNNVESWNIVNTFGVVHSYANTGCPWNTWLIVVYPFYFLSIYYIMCSLWMRFIDSPLELFLCENRLSSRILLKGRRVPVLIWWTFTWLAP